MGFVRFACFLLVALPVTSLSIMKFHQGLYHQEDKDSAKSQGFASLEKKLLSNINGGRRLGVKELMPLESSKSLGGGSEEKSSKMAVSSSFNGESGKNRKKISRFERKKLGSGSSLVYNNADYLTYMHHPPKHN